MNEEPESSASSDAVASARGVGCLSFDRVTFSYDPDRPILKEISFTVAPGKTVAIVGPSGAGKSSIVRLLVRLFEPDNGRILLDGAPISALSPSHLREVIAVVRQDARLLNDTIAYNIGFGKRANTAQQIEWAAGLAHIDSLILRLPDGYRTRVGERGLKLSGGEKQRLAIARAVLQKPKIFVFDEATSSLDTQTERDFMRNLMDVSRGITTLVIAHRLSTIVHAEEILVLDHGEIVERGSHAALLRNNGLYAAMWRAQQRRPDEDQQAVLTAKG